MAGARSRGGALLVLALCFSISGLIRAGDVIAALPDRQSGDAAAAADAAPGTGTETGGAETMAPGIAEAKALVAELRQRRVALAEREAKLEERAQILELIEARLRERLAELEAAQRKLEATAALVDDAAGKDVRHLASMYEQMKPKQAGQIFNEMDPNFAAGFLGQMNAPAAALILASMDAEKAYTVSLLLAGRNVDKQ